MVSEREKLIRTGLSDNQRDDSLVSDYIPLLRDVFDDYEDKISFTEEKEGFDDYRESLEDFEDFAVEVRNGETRADKFVSRLEILFESFDAYVDYTGEQESFDEYAANIISPDGVFDVDNNDKPFGIIIHRDEAVSRDGVPVPAGTVEIVGTEVHVSGYVENTDAEQVDNRSGKIEVVEVSTDKQSYTIGESVIITATVENTGDVTDKRSIPFSVNGEIVETRKVVLTANSTAEIEVEYVTDESAELEIDVDGLVENVVVLPAGIQ